jgi:Uma2 family endonuclease
MISSVPALPVPSAPLVPSDDTTERRFAIHGVSWDQYLALRETLEDHVLRMTYAEGTLELMSPSGRHERIKSLLGRLLETYALARGLRLHAGGSTTFRHEAAERGLEPDECYWVGPDEGEYPHLVIEVSLSRGIVDKLAIYATMRVPEVWMWRGERLEVNVLGPDGYAVAPRSELLPDLDVEELARHARMPDQAEATRAWWTSLGAAGASRG